MWFNNGLRKASNKARTELKDVYSNMTHLPWRKHSFDGAKHSVLQRKKCFLLSLHAHAALRGEDLVILKQYPRVKTVRRLPEARDCSEASSPSKAFLTSLEYLLKFWHHLSGTSSQNTCHGSFQSQIAFVPWHYHLFEARCVCVCVRACLFSSLKWLLFISLMDALC